MWLDCLCFLRKKCLLFLNYFCLTNVPEFSKLSLNVLITFTCCIGSILWATKGKEHGVCIFWVWFGVEWERQLSFTVFLSNPCSISPCRSFNVQYSPTVCYHFIKMIICVFLIMTRYAHEAAAFIQLTVGSLHVK